MALVDVDKLYAQYQELCKGIACMSCPFLNAEDNKCELESMILQQPTVDAEPVRHGHWEEKKVTYDDKATMIPEWQSAKCSVCGLYDTRPHLYYPIWSNYCPHCGSKMDVPDTNIGKMEDKDGID